MAVKAGVTVGVMVGGGVIVGTIVNVGNIVCAGIGLEKSTVGKVGEQPPINNSRINPEALCVMIFFFMEDSFF
jgi:hypothetical protein